MAEQAGRGGGSTTGTPKRRPKTPPPKTDKPATPPPRTGRPKVTPPPRTGRSGRSRGPIPTPIEAPIVETATEAIEQKERFTQEQIKAQEFSRKHISPAHRVLPTTQITPTHAEQETILIHGKTPSDFGENVQIHRDPRSFREAQERLSQEIPTFEEVVEKTVEEVEKSPQLTEKFIDVREFMTSTPQREEATEIISQFGEGVFTEVQEKPLENAAWFGLGLTGGTAVRGVGKAAGVVASYVPASIRTVVAGAAAAAPKLPTPVKKVITKLPEIAFTGAFSVEEHERVTQPVFTGYDEEGFPIMREPTKPEIAYRLGETAVISTAVLAGTAADKALATPKTQLVDEIKKTTEDVVTFIKGFRTTTKEQPFLQQITTKVKLDTVKASDISSIEIRKYLDEIKGKDVRELVTKTTFTETNILGEIAEGTQVETVKFIKKQPLPVKSGQQVSLEDVSIIKISRDKVGIDYGKQFGGEITKRPDEWTVDLKSLKTPKLKVNKKPLERFDDSKSFKRPFEIDTITKHTRGTVIGDLPKTPATPDKSIVTLKVRTDLYPTKFGKFGNEISPIHPDDIPKLGTREFDVKFKQTDVSEFFRESVKQVPSNKFEKLFGHSRKPTFVELKGEQLKAFESKLPIIKKIDSGMKPLISEPKKKLKDTTPITTFNAIDDTVKFKTRDTSRYAGGITDDVEDVYGAQKLKIETPLVEKFDRKSVFAEQIVDVEQVESFTVGKKIVTIKPKTNLATVPLVSLIPDTKSVFDSSGKLKPVFDHGQIGIQRMKPIQEEKTTQKLASRSAQKRAPILAMETIKPIPKPKKVKKSKGVKSTALESRPIKPLIFKKKEEEDKKKAKKSKKVTKFEVLYTNPIASPFAPIKR